MVDDGLAMSIYRRPRVEKFPSQESNSKKLIFVLFLLLARWFDVVNEKSLKDDVDMGRDVVAG